MTAPPPQPAPDSPLGPGEDLHRRLQAQFDDLNAANELRLSRYAVMIALAGAGVSAWFGISLDATLGVSLGACTVGFGLYHLDMVAAAAQVPRPDGGPTRIGVG